MITSEQNLKIQKIMEEMKNEMDKGTDIVDVLKDYAEHTLAETREYTENVVLAAYFLGWNEANNHGW